MAKSVISLSGMEFYAFHGCYDLEQRVGNRFVVDVEMEAELGDAPGRDDISSTVNYLDVYRAVEKEMRVKSRILENVAVRIAAAVIAGFAQVERVEVRVSKMAPPLGGKVASASVKVSKSRF